MMQHDGDTGGTPPLAGSDIIKKPAYDKNFPWRWDLESDEELPTDPDWIDHDAPKIPDNKIFRCITNRIKTSTTLSCKSMESIKPY
eukprot:UN07044